MKRRKLIGLIGGAAVFSLPAHAQQTPAVGATIGLLVSESIPDWMIGGVREGLGESGFVEGRNLTIVYRAAEGRADRLPTMAANLVSARVSAIIATGGPLPTRAAKAATTTIPIVFAYGGDPVADGPRREHQPPGGQRHRGDVHWRLAYGEATGIDARAHTRRDRSCSPGEPREHAGKESGEGWCRRGADARPALARPLRERRRRNGRSLCGNGPIESRSGDRWRGSDIRLHFARPDRGAGAALPNSLDERIDDTWSGRGGRPDQLRPPFSRTLGGRRAATSAAS